MRQRLMPPIMLGAFHLRFDGSVPVAGMTWALLSRDAEGRLLREGRLDPHDWSSGTTAWFIESVAPFNKRDWPDLHKWARKNMSPSIECCHYVHLHADGRPPRIAQLRRKTGGWRFASYTMDDWLNQRGI